MFPGTALVSSRPWTGSQSGEERGPVPARSSASASGASKQRRMYFALIRNTIRLTPRGSLHREQPGGLELPFAGPLQVALEVRRSRQLHREIPIGKPLAGVWFLSTGGGGGDPVESFRRARGPRGG